MWVSEPTVCIGQPAAPDDGVRAVPAEVCWLCGHHGGVIYRGLCDVRGRAAGEWSWRRCDSCRLLWLDPRPAREHIGRLYRGYYTHGQGAPARGWLRLREHARLALLSAAAGYDGLAQRRWQRALGRAALLVPPLEEMARLGLMGLDGSNKGRVLDVGCGSGRWLSVMRQAGWQVAGVEPDPQASAVARERYGIEVFCGELDEARLSERGFDAVVLSHVLEHAAEPAALLAACRRLLRPGGRLALSTPNAESRGHRLFGEDWLHLDVPRHLQLFSESSLAAAFARAGFGRVSIRTAAKSAAATWLSSAAAGRSGRLRGLDCARAVAFHLSEWRAVRGGSGCGEELFAWAVVE